MNGQITDGLAAYKLNSKQCVKLNVVESLPAGCSTGTKYNTICLAYLKKRSRVYRWKMLYMDDYKSPGGNCYGKRLWGNGYKLSVAGKRFVESFTIQRLLL